jgi:hypothetical protein
MTGLPHRHAYFKPPFVLRNAVLDQQTGGYPMATILEGVDLGVALCNWHCGQGDPVYAVGSFLIAGETHYRGVVKQALGEIERNIRRFDREPKKSHGWTKKDRAELVAIKRGLQHMLDANLVSDDPTGLVAQSWLDNYEPKDEEAGA